MNFTFKKEEHLCSRKDIEALMLNGKTSFVHPFKVHWNTNHDFHSSPVKIAIAVPKRKFKRANKRNLIRRRIREAYRLNKHPLVIDLIQKQYQINILLVYISSDIMTFSDIEKKIKNVLESILADIQKITG